LLDKKVNVETTLIIFDEIQLCNRAITSLKYFNEEQADCHIVCAGSLLGVSIIRDGFSFPVGNVEMDYLYPLKFDEFLGGIGHSVLINKIIQCYNNNTQMPEIIHKKLMRIYREYLCIGGMPAAVKEYIQKEKNLVSFDRNLHENIINTYIADMSKYTKNVESVKIQAIYRSIPRQLAGTNKKFKYSTVIKGKQARDFGVAIEWLLLSRINLECSMIKKPEYPLEAYVESNYFKIYLNDIGLLVKLGNIPFKEIILPNQLLFIGAITENYVAQQIKENNRPLYYWRNDTYEVDFIVQINNNLIPIEVKAGTNNRSRSLSQYIKKYNPKYAIRISAKNYGFKNNIKSIPLYAAHLIK